jgi:hypothetical protein
MMPSRSPLFVAGGGSGVRYAAARWADIALDAQKIANRTSASARELAIRMRA